MGCGHRGDAPFLANSPADARTQNRDGIREAPRIARRDARQQAQVH
jgi:hypothetical protein